MTAARIGIIALGIVIAGLLGFGLWYSSFTFGQTDQVRGFITFFFVVATTGIILLIALSLFWNTDADDAIKRFGAAKELLTLVIGVLGTIMGFYFGSVTTGTANMSIGGIAVTPLVVHGGQETMLNGRFNGGTKPYTYKVIFADPSGTITSAQLDKMKIDDGKSDDGAFTSKIKVPSDVKSAVVFYTLSASDAKSVSAMSNGALYVEPTSGTPAPAPK